MLRSLLLLLAIGTFSVASVSAEDNIQPGMEEELDTQGQETIHEEEMQADMNTADQTVEEPAEHNEEDHNMGDEPAVDSSSPEDMQDVQ